MQDGVYQVTYKGICAGFVVRNGRVSECAPILRRKLDFWKTIAVRLENVVTDKILLDTGPSPRGAHRIQLALTCPALYAFDRVLVHPDAHSSRGPLVRGTIGHVGLAHHYARMGCEQHGMDPEQYHTPFDAIDMMVTKFGHEGKPFRQVIHDTYRGYVSQYAIERQEIVGVEVLKQYEVPDPLRPGMTNLFTQRWDLLTRDAAGKLWVTDHKFCASVDARTVQRYVLSIQFISMVWLAGTLLGDRFGGVKLNLIGIRGPSFTRPALPPAPDAVRRFPMTLAIAEKRIREVEALANPWDAERVFSEQVCMTAYGPCSCVDLCRYGKGHITMDGRVL